MPLSSEFLDVPCFDERDGIKMNERMNEIEKIIETLNYSDKITKYWLRNKIRTLVKNAFHIRSGHYNDARNKIEQKIFKTKFLDVNIPTLKGKDDTYIRKAYYGGATDLYKAYGKILNIMM